MSHLSPEDLKTWYEQGSAADRGRVIGHLAECPECRKALSAMAQSHEDIAAMPVVTAAEAAPMGYAARHPAKVERSWMSWLRPALALAGAAVVVLGVLWVTARPGPEDDAVRGSELTTLAPSGPTNVLEFRFASPFNVTRYRLVIRDAGGTLVYSGETAASPLVIDSGNRGRFATMVEYSWTVSALDPSGQVIAESKPRTFLLQP